MVHPVRAPSKEDHGVTSLHFHTPREIAAWVDTQDHGLGSEWLTAVCLGAQGEVLGVYPMFHGEVCGIDPEPSVTPMLAYATTLHTASILTVRRHNHRWTGPSQRSQAQLDIIEARVHDAGIQLFGCLVQDSTGMIHAVRCDQGNSGSSGPTSRPR